MSAIVLASGSPRRKELLEQIGLEFEVCPAKGEEVVTSEDPEQVVKELSAQKAEEVAVSLLEYNRSHRELTTPTDLIVIGADTVVACGGKILGKPGDEEEAFEMLAMLSGRSHEVYTGVTVVLTDGATERTGELTFAERTEVWVDELTEEEIRAYIATGEPMDKAGAYGIQGRFAIHIGGIRGDYQNVVGFPLARFYHEMKKTGIDLYARKDTKI